MAGMTHIEIPRVQAFVFQTDRLRDTVGRSALLAELIDLGGDDLRPMLEECNLDLVEQRPNGFTVSGAAEQRLAFVATYTRLLAERAPSLQTVVVSDPELPPSIALARARLFDPASATVERPLTAISCALTGGAADTRWRELPVATEVRAAREAGSTWLNDYAREADLPEGAQLSTNIDAIVPSRNESSRIAVVVADLNGLGDMLRTWSEQPGANEQDVAALLTTATRELSVHLARTVAAWSALSANGSFAVQGDPAELRFSWGTSDDAGARHSVLPFQPVIVGGDDLAFVCESRLAWGLTEAIFDYLAAPPEGSAMADIAMLGAPFSHEGALLLTYGVGIALTPRGYSLSAAHERAKTFAAHAKAERRSAIAEGLPDHHAVCWSVRAENAAAAVDLPPVWARALDGGVLSSAPHIDRLRVDSFRTLWQLLDPAAEGSLRSTAPTDPDHEPWGLQRSYLKSKLATQLLDPSLEIGDTLAEIGEQLVHQGPPLPRLARGNAFARDDARLLTAALELIDDCLVPPPVATATAAHEVTR